jgi:hypothetical protein
MPRTQTRFLHIYSGIFDLQLDWFFWWLSQIQEAILMGANYQSGAANDLLSLPYRDRQLIVVVRDFDNNVQPIQIRVGDYYSLDNFRKNLNPKSWFTKGYFTDTKSYGLIGYLIDKARTSTKTADNSSLRYLQNLRANQVQ